MTLRRFLIESLIIDKKITLLAITGSSEFNWLGRTVERVVSTPSSLLHVFLRFRLNPKFMHFLHRPLITSLLLQFGLLTIFRSIVIPRLSRNVTFRALISLSRLRCEAYMPFVHRRRSAITLSDMRKPVNVTTSWVCWVYCTLF